MIGKLRIGLPMWANPKWKGSLFPKGSSSKSFLAHYSSVFQTVEGNTTFYATPKADRLCFWRDTTPESFRFCFKFPRSVSHRATLCEGLNEAETFIRQLKLFATRLGPCYLQLPPSYDDIVDLTRFLSSTAPQTPIAVELRHPAFFDGGPFERDTNQILQELDVSRVHFITQRFRAHVFNDRELTSAQREKPQVPDRWNHTNGTVFIRYIGHPHPDHDAENLRQLAVRTITWLNAGLDAYIFIHQAPSDTESPAIARVFWDYLCEIDPKIKPMPAWPPNTLQLDLFN